jgi:hypothetical protein
VKPSKIPPEARVKAAEIAASKLNKPTYKDIALTFHMSEGYFAKLVHQELEKLREKPLP